MMDGTQGEGPAPVVIKKYANRRLYNTAKSSYVTLEHLSTMVREGDDFVVYDPKTGEDITRSVLTQIIFEEEAKGGALLPATFLRQIIRLYGDTLQGFVPGYLEASMETFTRNQEKMREQVRATFGANPAFMGFEAMARTNMEWFQNAMTMFSPYAVKGAAGPTPDAMAAHMTRATTGKPEPTAAEEDAKAKGGKKARAGDAADAPASQPAASADDDLQALKKRLMEMQTQLDRISSKS